VIDSIDVRRGVDKGLFEPLPEDKLPFGDLYPEVMLDQFTKIGGKRYGITEKFGYNTIGFNKSKVDPNDMQTLQSLVSDKYKGRIAIYDYYLPVMGMAALAAGKKTAERAGSVCLNSFARSISGILPGLRSRGDALLGCDAGRA